MDYTPEKLRAMAENWDDHSRVQVGWRRTESQSNAKQLRAHAAKIEECEKMRALVVVVRSLVRGAVPHREIDAEIEAALKEPT